jgi:hypothetical protein
MEEYMEFKMDYNKNLGDKFGFIWWNVPQD